MMGAGGRVARELKTCVECAVEFAPRLRRSVRCGSCQFKRTVQNDRARQNGDKTVAVSRWENNGRRCWWCGEPLPRERIEFDHVIPLSAGGKDGENLVPSCKTCNLKKADGPPPATAFGAVQAGRRVELTDVLEVVR